MIIWLAIDVCIQKLIRQTFLISDQLPMSTCDYKVHLKKKICKICLIIIVIIVLWSFNVYARLLIRPHVNKLVYEIAIMDWFKMLEKLWSWYLTFSLKSKIMQIHLVNSFSDKLKLKEKPSIQMFWLVPSVSKKLSQAGWWNHSNFHSKVPKWTRIFC